MGVTFICVKETHVIVLFQVLEILIFVLSQGLSNVRVLNNIQNRLSLLLQPIVCQESFLSLLVELYPTKPTINPPVLLLLVNE